MARGDGRSRRVDEHGLRCAAAPALGRVPLLGPTHARGRREFKGPERAADGAAVPRKVAVRVDAFGVMDCHL